MEYFGKVLIDNSKNSPYLIEKGNSRITQK